MSKLWKLAIVGSVAWLGALEYRLHQMEKVTTPLTGMSGLVQEFQATMESDEFEEAVRELKYGMQDRIRDIDRALERMRFMMKEEAEKLEQRRHEKHEAKEGFIRTANKKPTDQKCAFLGKYSFSLGNSGGEYVEMHWELTVDNQCGKSKELNVLFESRSYENQILEMQTLERISVAPGAHTFSGKTRVSEATNQDAAVVQFRLIPITDSLAVPQYELQPQI